HDRGVEGGAPQERGDAAEEQHGEQHDHDQHEAAPPHWQFTSGIGIAPATSRGSACLPSSPSWSSGMPLSLASSPSPSSSSFAPLPSGSRSFSRSRGRSGSCTLRVATRSSGSSVAAGSLSRRFPSWSSGSSAIEISAASGSSPASLPWDASQAG